MNRADEPAFHRARIRTLVAVMLCYLLYYTGRQNFGFAIPGIAEELGLSKAALGWCSTALLWSYAIGQAINGPLADRHGGRRLMTLGGLLSFLMNAMTSFAGGWLGVLVPWAGNGFVQSMGWAPGSRILSNWWGKMHRGRVYGAYVFAAGLSSPVTYVMAAAVVDFGWRWIFRGSVISMLFGCVAFWFLVREKPSDAGFSDEFDDADSHVRVVDRAINGMNWWQRYLCGFRSMPFMVACAAIGFQNLARYGLLVWVPVHFLGENWKNSSDKWIAIALPIGMAAGAVSAGWISDRLFRGRRAMPIVVFLGIASCCAMGMLMLHCESLIALPLLFLTGFFVYGPQSAFWALCPDLQGRNLAGTGTGMMNFFAYLFAGLGEPLIGHLIETHHSTLMVFPVVSTACLVGAISMTFISKKV